MSLVVTKAAGAISIQDLGRTGHMHEGVPPGGAIVRALLVAANREAANRDDAAALEVFGVVTVRAERTIKVAMPDAARMLDAGEELTVSSPRWTYLAVHGGIAAPEVLGGRGALPGERVKKAIASHPPAILRRASRGRRCLPVDRCECLPAPTSTRSRPALSRCCVRRRTR